MFDHSVWRRGTGSHNYGRVSDHDGRVSDHSVTVCFRDPERNITRMDMREMDRFRTVKEITGYLMVQARHQLFRNFSFFSSLEVISGREVDP